MPLDPLYFEAPSVLDTFFVCVHLDTTLLNTQQIV